MTTKQNCQFFKCCFSEMASQIVQVIISGPALSLLIYENINSKFEQEGFLLGTFKEVKKTSVTDYHEEIQTIHTINVTGVFPVDIPHMFYKGDGELIEEKLDQFLGENKKNVVAWFKYRKYRQFGFRFSLREQTLHEELMKYFNIKPLLFTCCILTTATHDNKATRSFSHAFVNVNERDEQRMVSMHVKNLGDPCHTYQGNSKPSDTFMNLFNKINKNQPVLQLGNDIHDAIQGELKKSVPELSDLEKKLIQLRSEVQTLTKQFRRVSLVKYAEGDKVETKEKLIEIEVPLNFISDPTNKEDGIEIIEKDELSEKYNEETNFVDLTLSDEDDKPVRKLRSTKIRPKNETPKKGRLPTN